VLANKSAKISQIGFGEASARTALLKICDKAMASEPANRYATAKELAADLGAWLDRQRDAPARLSFSLACVIMGLAASVLLVVGLKSALTTPHTLPEPPRTVLSPRTDSSSADSPIRLVSTNSPPSPASPAPTTSASHTPTQPPAAIAASAKFVGNRETHKVHRPNCPYVQRMTESHREGFESIAQALNQYYSACGTCRPHD
jgi:hypothetical protein